MSKSRRPRPPTKPAPVRRRSILPIVAVIAVVIGLVAVGGWWWTHARQADPLATYQKLQGRWQRGDGGYIIDIRGVDAAGKLAAAYLNPRPINVAKAEASQDGGAVKVVIELRDVNYPGSTYNLVYVPADDRLTGTYFQAIERATYDVYFTRIKP
jgi:cell division septal protein FtsQ